ncbi:MAG TPA: hypothetical protein VFR94_13835 [Nitrososphaeraceae archaeon]|nr:hypothetical protein [Nitrososphaeraceae archaeon]
MVESRFLTAALRLIICGQSDRFEAVLFRFIVWMSNWSILEQEGLINETAAQRYKTTSVLLETRFLN